MELQIEHRRSVSQLGSSQDGYSFKIRSRYRAQGIEHPDPLRYRAQGVSLGEDIFKI